MNLTWVLERQLEEVGKTNKLLLILLKYYNINNVNVWNIITLLVMLGILVTLIICNYYIVTLIL